MTDFVPESTNAMREALKLAQPIIEADHHAAKASGDSDWEGQSFTVLEAVNGALAEMPPATEQACPPPADVIALVLAGRAVVDNGGIADGDAGQNLDEALEAFSARVCYDDDAGSLPEAHADPCTCGLAIRA